MKQKGSSERGGQAKLLEKTISEAPETASEAAESASGAPESASEAAESASEPAELEKRCEKSTTL